MEELEARVSMLKQQLTDAEAELERLRKGKQKVWLYFSNQYHHLFPFFFSLNFLFLIFAMFTNDGHSPLFTGLPKEVIYF